MKTFMTIVMYTLWVIALVAIVATTLTDFKYEDLNVIAACFTVFSLINTFFVVTKK